MEQSPTWLTLTTHANIGTVLHRKLRCVRLLHRVLDCINCWFGPQVVHAGLKRCWSDAERSYSNKSVLVRCLP